MTTATAVTLPRREETAKPSPTLEEILHINRLDISQALAKQPPVDPATPAGNLAVRIDRARAKARRWVRIAATLQGVTKRLINLAERRRVALADARADAANVRAVAASHQRRIDDLTEALEAGDRRENDLRKRVATIPALQDEIDRLRPLARPEEQRRAKARAERAKAKADALAAQWGAALEDDPDVVPQSLHRAVARTVGATAAYAWVWASKAGAKPVVEYEAAYHTTPAGSIVHYPSAYGWPTIRHSAVRNLIVGRGWLQRNLARLARLECGLPR